MLCGEAATGKSDVEKLAWLWPATVASAPLPSSVVPSKKVTNPVGVPVTAVTVAVKVTVSPRVIVVGETTIVVVVALVPCAKDRAGANSATQAASKNQLAQRTTRAPREDSVIRMFAVLP